MNILVVHAHYEPRSFSAALKDAAVEALSAAGHRVQVSDLYAMGWNPVASAADFGQRKNPDYCVYALEQRHGVETGTLAADVLAEIRKIQWCDLLILNFPLFWFSTPAILKGWMDRVFVSGLFYGGKRFYDRGGMRGKKALVSLTLGGQPHMFGPQGIHGELEAMLRPLLRGSLAYAGFEVLRPFVAYHVPYISDEARGGILSAYRRYLGDLPAIPALEFPSMDDFDERLHPRKADAAPPVT